MLDIKRRQPESFRKWLTLKRSRKEKLGTGVGKEDPVSYLAGETEGTVLRRDFKASSRDISLPLHLLNENFNKASLLSRERDWRWEESRIWVTAARGRRLQEEASGKETFQST